MSKLIAWLFTAALLCDAHAAQFAVTVKDENGSAVSDAVVTLAAKQTSGGGRAAPDPHQEKPFEMMQKNMQFHPYVLVIPRGESVSFPNLDPFRHHVYSFSPAKPFQLTLYGKGETRSITFDEPGIIAVGCNIHDNMRAYIYVHDSQFANKTDTDGRASFIDVPNSEYLITVWHPRLKPRGSQIERAVQIGDEPRIEMINIDLRPARQPVRTHYN